MSTMQTINLKVTSINRTHVHATLFMNGVNLGNLVFDHGEYQLFSTILLMGVKQTIGYVQDNSDYSIFKKWAEENAD
jgi:hypothetical protein